MDGRRVLEAKELASAYSGVNEFSGTVSNGFVMQVYVALQESAILRIADK